VHPQLPGQDVADERAARELVLAGAGGGGPP